MILATKLQPPSLKPNTLRRERLLKLLKNSLERKLVLITGDAGYGKTTLLAQVIGEANLPCVFYDLDKGDSDLVVFCFYLVHGLEKLHKGLASRTKGLLEQGGEVGKNYELLFGTLINELVEKRKEELFFVLDDYHALPDDSLVHKALDYFIDHLPDIVHVMISSRTMPPLPSLAKWRAKEDLFELTREGLRFTEEEVKALLSEVYKLVLSEEEVKRVSEQTEGWITGIRLILQSAGKDGKTVKETLNGYVEANQPLFEYFANEILASEVLEAQDFLRKSSILDLLTPKACDNIFGVVGSGERLKALEKRNFFLSEVGQEQYKYHRLFREFLVSRITDEKFKTSLHLKAADYYQRKEQWEQAIEHYLEAGSFEWAGKVITQIAEGMVETARFTTLKRWLQRIPRDVFEKQPGLLVVQGKLYFGLGNYRESEESFIQAERHLRKRSDATALSDTLLARGRLLRLREDHREALTTLRKALATCPASEVKLRIRIYTSMGLAWLECDDLKKAELYLVKAIRAAVRIQDAPEQFNVKVNLGVLFTEKGELRRAFDLFVPLIAKIGEDYHSRDGILLSNAAAVALNLGKVEMAERFVKQGWGICQPYEDPPVHVVFHRRFGALYIAKGEWDLARQHLEKAREGYAKLGWARMEVATLRETARLYRYEGNFAEAQRHLDLAQSRLVGDMGNQGGSMETTLLIERGLLQVSLGQCESAEKTFKTALRLARRVEWKVGEFYAELGGAAVFWGNGKKPGASRLFRRALLLAKLKGYDGILAREIRFSTCLAELAQTAAQMKGAEFDYLRGLLTTSDDPRLSKIPLSEPLRVQLFGRFDLLVKGVSHTPRLRRRTTKAIFSFFLLHPREDVSWEEITSWAWPESPPSAANMMFRRALWEIRKCAPSLRSLILYQDNRYRLNPALQVWVDALEFQRCLAQASGATEEAKKTAFLEGAVALYEGPLLPGIYYSWADNLRNAFEEQYTKALGSLSEKYAKNAEYDKCITCCHKYLQVNNLNEEMHRLLIANYVHLGDKSKALKHYELLRKTLRKELKSEPSPETTSLIESLR